MALLAWSNHFVTGIELVDTRHKGLVDLINAVAPQLAAIGEEPAHGVRPLLDRLAQYALTHFREEEALMAAYAIDPRHFAHHQHSHTAFALDVTQMISDASADHNVSGSSLLRFLTSWLTFHILSEDQCMARQLRAINNGESPEMALSRESPVDSSVSTVLVGALTDLFSLVSQRNHALKVLNQELALTKADLASSNQQLEARSIERTTQLKETNDELDRVRKALIESTIRDWQLQPQSVPSDEMTDAGVAHETRNPIGSVNSNYSSLTSYTGQGIPDDVQKRNFAPFLTTRPADKDSRPGLSVSWGILNQGDGRVEAKSNPGLGITFKITLPIAAPATSANAGSTP